MCKEKFLLPPKLLCLFHTNLSTITHFNLLKNNTSNVKPFVITFNGVEHSQGKLVLYYLL